MSGEKPTVNLTLTLIVVQGHHKQRQKVWVQLNFVTLGLGSDGYQHYKQEIPGTVPGSSNYSLRIEHVKLIFSVSHMFTTYQ